MGTKLESAVSLLLAPNNNSKKLISTTSEWGAFCLKAQPVYNYKTATDHFPSNLIHSYTMVDRMVNDDDLYSLQSIKKTMLEHDHLFKQQVKELHRLYGVQRMLMKDLKSKVTTHSQKVKQGCFEENEEEPEIELTLGLGYRKYSDKEMKKKYQEQPHCSVDLLLYPNSNSEQFQVMARQQKELSDRKEQTPSVEDFPETVSIPDQASKRPHWLLQSLSSHKT